jgi:hypothetical protein
MRKRVLALLAAAATCAYIAADLKGGRDRSNDNAVKLDLGLVILVPALVVLTDLDHLPAFLGLAQPIRPAHSIIFILCTVALMATVIRKPDVEFASLSAFFAHLSVDTGVFPAFSPVSFQYYDIGEFRILALLAAVAFALAAGLAMRHNKQGAIV